MSESSRETTVLNGPRGDTVLSTTVSMDKDELSISIVTKNIFAIIAKLCNVVRGKVVKIKRKHWQEHDDSRKY